MKMSIQKSDTEIIDLVLTYLYNDGKYKRVYLQEILDYHNITHLHDRDIRILSKKFTANSWTQENLITYCGFAEDEINISYDKYPIQLTDFGIQFIKEHKSYSKYQKLISKDKQKKEVSEKRKTLLTNTDLFVKIILGIATIVSTIFVVYSSQELKTSRQNIEQLENKNDSLKQLLQTRQNKLDTAHRK
jgi:hypothetical protein